MSACDKKITLYIRSISNKLFEIEIDQYATVNEFRHKVASAVKVHTENIQLLMKNEVLAEDDATLFEYDVFDQDILHFIVKESIKHTKETDITSEMKQTFTHRIRMKKHFHTPIRKDDSGSESSD